MASAEEDFETEEAFQKALEEIIKKSKPEHTARDILRFILGPVGSGNE